MLGKVLTYTAVCALSLGVIQTAFGQIESKTANGLSAQGNLSIVVSQRSVSIERLRLRIAKDQALADLLSLAHEKGGGHPYNPMEYTYTGGQVISIAALSDSTPALCLLTMGRSFEGKAFLFEMHSGYVQLYDTQNSLQFSTNGQSVNSNPLHSSNNSECVICMSDCIQDWLLEHWAYYVIACGPCMVMPSLASCFPCIAWWAGTIARCWTECVNEGACLHLFPQIHHRESRGYVEASGEIINTGSQPFNPTAQITFRLQTDCNASLRIYDLLGREIATLANGSFQAGTHTVTFDGSNRPSGLYFCVLKTASTVDSRRLLLVK